MTGQLGLRYQCKQSEIRFLCTHSFVWFKALIATSDNRMESFTAMVPTILPTSDDSTVYMVPLTRETFTSNGKIWKIKFSDYTVTCQDILQLEDLGGAFLFNDETLFYQGKLYSSLNLNWNTGYNPTKLTRNFVKMKFGSTSPIWQVEGKYVAVSCDPANTISILNDEATLIHVMIERCPKGDLVIDSLDANTGLSVVIPRKIKWDRVDSWLVHRPTQNLFVAAVCAPSKTIADILSYQPSIFYYNWKTQTISNPFMAEISYYNDLNGFYYDEATQR